MKFKALLFAVLLAASAPAFAQEANSDNTVAKEEASKGPFVTNNFGSNWFVGAGVGVNINVDGPFSGPRFGYGFAADFNFGKWIDPMWGIRAGVLGINNNHTGDDKYGFAFIHGDVMWNITNQFWGYKQNRVYQAVPYLTAGLYWPCDRSKNFAAGAGLLNKIRLTDRLDLDIDLMGVFLKQASIEKVSTPSGLGAVAAATVGVSYKFGTHTWETKEAALMPATVAAAEAAAALAAAQAHNEKIEAEKAAAQEAANKAEAENEALRNELATTAAQNEAIVKNLMSTPAVVFFEIGQATLSVKELEHFDRIVKTMLNQDKDIKFTVTGYADHNTGSARRNKQLQKQRVNYIVKLLTGKYNLSKDQFEIVQSCCKKSLYETIELNRAVVIEAAE